MNGLRIVVTGLIGSIPMAGLTLHYLQYVLGLRELGHEVLYLEDTGTWSYDPVTDSMIEDPTASVTYLKQVMDQYGLSGSWAFIDHQGRPYGLIGKKFDEFISSADLFINVTGAGIVRDSYLRIPKRIYIDTDPGFIQMRVDQGNDKDISHLRRHTDYFSFGCNIGKSNCNIPTGGFLWTPTNQPVVMSLWPMNRELQNNAPFTTILKWQVYDPVEHKGEKYGLKNMEFLKFQELPKKSGLTFEIAMSGSPPVDNLRSLGWRCKDARLVSDSIENYKKYIQSSRGEWSIAKNGYVKTRSGWFSDRSATYLALGRPVVLQSTGYEEWLQTGVGLFSFTNLEEANEALKVINMDYKRHCKAARELAEQFFDSGKVLTKMLGRVTN